MPEPPSSSAQLTAAWQETLARWTDPQAHQQFLRRAAASNELAAAGRLYRIVLAHSPEDAHALASREELVRLALLPGLATREADGEKDELKRLRQRNLLIAALVCISILGLIGVAILAF